MLSETNLSSKTHSHAIVIGGSMAGLLACRVLSDHFDRVTLIEREGVSSAPQFFPENIPQPLPINCSNKTRQGSLSLLD
jgi:heterodisulfide reductase subunit A-like polyferredoxin